MKILILGATGRTGAHLLQQAIAAKHDVTGFVRDPQKLEVTDPKLRVVVGDARNAEDLVAALQGQDAVISTLGSNTPGNDLITASTKALLDAMSKTGVRRIVMMSSFLASPNFKQSGTGKFAGWATKPLVSDKLSGEDVLKQSDLDWTIVYATRLDGAEPGGYRIVDENEPVSANQAIARADVAEFLLGIVDQKTSYKKSFVITKT